TVAGRGGRDAEAAARGPAGRPEDAVVVHPAAAGEGPRPAAGFGAGRGRGDRPPSLPGDNDSRGPAVAAAESRNAAGRRGECATAACATAILAVVGRRAGRRARGGLVRLARQGQARRI